MRSLIWTVAVGAVCVGSACGISRDDFPDRIASTYCERVYACCTQEEVADAGTLGADKAACRERVKANYGHAGLFKEEEGHGHLTWNAAMAEACVAKVSALTCTDLKTAATATPVECTKYLEPHVEAGGACGADESCIGGGRCVKPPDAGVAITVCVPLAKEGERCDFAGCVSGTYCSGTCSKTKADGESCFYNLECTTGGCNNKNPDGGIGSCGLRGGAGTTCFVTKGCAVSSGVDLAALGLLVLALALRPRLSRGR